MNTKPTQNRDPNAVKPSKQGTQSLWEVLKLICDVRMLWIFLLGFCSGYPLAVWSSVQNLWLASLDIKKSTIGLFGLLGFGYAVNWLWAPGVDHIRIPWLHRIGHWKSWLVLCLTVMAMATVCISLFVIFEPEKSFFKQSAFLSSIAFLPVYETAVLFLFAIFLFVIAWTSATLDIVTAAYRINIIKTTETRLVSLAASMEVAGWWVGFGFIAGLAFWLVEGIGWNMVYAGLALIFVLLAVTVGFGLGEPERLPREPIKRFFDLLDKTHFGALIEFFKRNGFALAILVLAFVFSFKLGEAFLGKMSIVFYENIGYTAPQIGTYSKWVGTLITVGTTIVAGFFVARFKILPTLVISGLGMSATNIMFAWIAINATKHGMPSEVLYLWTTILDGISGAIAGVAFVSFITHYTSRVHSATQYAALASLGTLGRTTLASFSGFLVEGLGDNWALFFILTSVVILPVLLLLWPIHRIMKRRGT
ncbi:MAG: AmpG family muropeptide MFS transporter [Gammaproteobacteria bacterium]|nr:MFS transporter [Gammaproteobacteria bacterium]MXX95440.1 AmpG family muropeptide MFS transporter [Gammaproteobacteria bacterium]MYF52281.1 AmpG family muropeptide MFS transporter [Gammaproteobacteria bacterium]MYK43208.1 AmpG family muropeptide MFS transporter [Gammaproteobacteria bacterium]